MEDFDVLQSVPGSGHDHRRAGAAVIPEPLRTSIDHMRNCDVLRVVVGPSQSPRHTLEGEVEEPIVIAINLKLRSIAVGNPEAVEHVVLNRSLHIYGVATQRDDTKSVPDALGTRLL